jgi:hypothetical protein
MIAVSTFYCPYHRPGRSQDSGLILRKFRASERIRFGGYVGEWPVDKFSRLAKEKPPLGRNAETETKFFATVIPAEIEFVKDGQGKVTHLVLHRNGHDVKAPNSSGPGIETAS